MKGIDRRSWFVAMGVAVLVALSCGLVAATGDVPGWEEAMFHALNDLPAWLYRPMWLFQLPGLLLVPLGIAAVAAALRKWWLAAALVVFVPLKLLVENGVVKRLAERERPGTSICGYDTDDPSAFDTTCAVFRGDVPLEGLSFVSGHAIITWGVCRAAVARPAGTVALAAGGDRGAQLDRTRVPGRTQCARRRRGRRDRCGDRCRPRADRERGRRTVRQPTGDDRRKLALGRAGR